MPNYQASPPYPRGLERNAVGFSFGALGNATIAASPGGIVRNADGSVTLTTTAPHNFLAGQICTLAPTTIVGGTRFGANYIIKSIGSPTTATLIAVDDVVAHQAPDTGGGGTASSIQFEQPAAPQAGAAFGLPAAPMVGTPFGFFTDGVFSGAPGAFEVDIQVAEFDVDSLYQTISNGNVTTVDATNNTFHFDATWTGAHFARLLLKSRANAVGFIGTIRA